MLRSWLGDRLPAYMVPAAFVALDALPLNASGKLDRRALPAPAEETTGYVAPGTPTEQTLCAIWAETLGWNVSAPGTTSSASAATRSSASRWSRGPAGRGSN
ncbi:hypothetical protein OIM90_17965 [Streptomyces sp. AD16]|nr:hypothetical protein OIM90_17965 [Streptomyces sp. AD16]